MALSAGSIAFVGFNADGTDGFACIVLDEIPAGQVIYFRDDEWNGTAFNTGEGISSWTNNTGAPIAVGTVVEFSAVSTAAPTASHGQLALVSGSQNLGASDETLYAYTSTGDATTGSFTFLSAVASGGYTAAMTLDGTGLTAGIDAIDFKPQDDDADVFAYNPASGGSSSSAWSRPSLRSTSRPAGSNSTLNGRPPLLLPSSRLSSVPPRPASPIGKLSGRLARKARTALGWSIASPSSCQPCARRDW